MFTSINFVPLLPSWVTPNPQPPADGLVPLGRCGGQPWAPWALAWHLAWLSLPWRRGMRTPFLRWLPGRWMTVQCSCWNNRQKYRKDAISGWVLKQKNQRLAWCIGIWAACLMQSPSKKGISRYFWQFDTLHCFVGFWFDHGGYCGLAMLAGNLIVVLDFYIFFCYTFFWDPWTQKTI